MPKIRTILQSNPYECASACLRMIYSHHYTGPNSFIGKLLNYGRDGVSAAEIVKVSRNIGLLPRPLSINDPSYIKDLSLPLIVHWNGNHYVVISNYEKDRFTVHDPSKGKYLMYPEEVSKHLSGIVVEFRKADNFRPGLYNIGVLSLIRSVIMDNKVILYIAAAVILSISTQYIAIQPISIMRDLINNGLSITSELLFKIFLLLTIMFAFNIFRVNIFARMKRVVDGRMYTAVMSKLMRVNMLFFSTRSRGDVINRLGSLASVRELISTRLISSIIDLVFIVFYTFSIYKISSILMIPLVIYIFLVALLIVIFNGRIYHLTQQAVSAQAEVQSSQIDIFSAIQTIKYMSAESTAHERLLNVFSKSLGVEYDRSNFDGIYNSILDSARITLPVVMVLLSIFLGANYGIRIGDVTFVAAIAPLIATPISSIAASILQFQFMGAQLDRIDDILVQGDENVGKYEMEDVELIEVKNLTYYYPGNIKPALKNIQLEINRGESIVIVGSSGSGKSTLAKIISGLIECQSGRLYYDGVDSSVIGQRNIRRLFSVVNQDVYLINDTIEQNITLGQNIDLSALEYAVSSACLVHDILAFPNALKSRVGEGGVMLSGGQRQRVAIARAFYKNSSIFLFDEGTSNLDATTRSNVEDNLKNLRRTKIIITHDLKYIDSKDKIVVMSDGSIVGFGSHAELAKNCKEYINLLNSSQYNTATSNT